VCHIDAENPEQAVALAFAQFPSASMTRFTWSSSSGRPPADKPRAKGPHKIAVSAHPAQRVLKEDHCNSAVCSKEWQ